MNHRWLTALVVAACVAHASHALAQRASIGGVVTRATGGEPAAGATVKLVSEPPSVAQPGTQTQSTTSGADGSFKFDNVEAGTYWIVANLPGFLPAE